MTTVWNIRGTNGSGKSTLARAFLPDNLAGSADGGPVDLCWYDAPTKRDPSRRLRAEGYLRHRAGDPLGVVGVIGPYRTACGGLDAMPSFAVQMDAASYMLAELPAQHVIMEGVLASTVYGSWGAFADKLAQHHHRFAFVYLQVDLEACLWRIQERQRKAGQVKDIKFDLVADKIKAIRATREKALSREHLVYDLPAEQDADEVANTMTRIMIGEGEQYRAQ